MRDETVKLVGGKSGIPASVLLTDISQPQLLAIPLQQGQAVLQQPDVDPALRVSVGTIHLHNKIEQDKTREEKYSIRKNLVD